MCRWGELNLTSSTWNAVPRVIVPYSRRRSRACLSPHPTLPTLHETAFLSPSAGGIHIPIAPAAPPRLRPLPLPQWTRRGTHLDRRRSTIGDNAPCAPHWLRRIVSIDDVDQPPRHWRRTSRRGPRRLRSAPRSPIVGTRDRRLAGQSPNRCRSSGSTRSPSASMTAVKDRDEERSATPVAARGWRQRPLQFLSSIPAPRARVG